MQALAKNTRIVVTTAGPFRLYGTNLVRSCVEFGTDYCDITGEIDWIREMIDLYGAQAKESGARIVFCTGADSLPWDLANILLKEKLEAKGEGLVKAEHFNEGAGFFSGGTLKTLLIKLDGEVTRGKQRLKLDRLVAEADDSGRVVSDRVRQLESGHPHQRLDGHQERLRLQGGSHHQTFHRRLQLPLRVDSADDRVTAPTPAMALFPNRLSAVPGGRAQT